MNLVPVERCPKCGETWYAYQSANGQLSTPIRVCGCYPFVGNGQNTNVFGMPTTSTVN